MDPVLFRVGMVWGSIKKYFARNVLHGFATAIVCVRLESGKKQFLWLAIIKLYSAFNTKLKNTILRRKLYVEEMKRTLK